LKRDYQHWQKINLDFELGMVYLLREEFREVEIKGCRLHLGQAWYRKIQSLGQ
jgi:hypothetical protein